MLIDQSFGQRPQTPEEAEVLTNQGFFKCYSGNCNFHISPESKQTILNQGAGYYTCPSCKRSYNIMEEVPWHGASDKESEYNKRKLEQERYEPYDDEEMWQQRQQTGFVPGGTTRIGLSLQEQAQIGEDVIEHLGSLPGYGPIVWWHQGGATAPSPLDGATKEWGIEVKTIGYDATHHRFIPGSRNEKAQKNAQAKEMGLKGILGILVLLNYRTSEADVYVKPMTLEPWQNVQGKTFTGVSAFRSGAGEHLLERVPFRNPFMSADSGLPSIAGAGQEEETPF